MISLIKKKSARPRTNEPIFWAQWHRITTVTKTALAKIMSRGSTYSVGEVEGILTDFSQHICDALLDGNAVYVQGLGTFNLKVSGKAKENPADVTTQDLSVSVTFEPDDDITQRLNSEREFQFIK